MIQLRTWDRDQSTRKDRRCGTSRSRPTTAVSSPVPTPTRTNPLTRNRFEGQLDLILIRAAWDAGLDLEDLADGFGLGLGTQGDWSGIRDSSPAAIRMMLERVLNYTIDRLRV